MKQTYLNSFCARCLTLLVLALLSTNLAWGETATIIFASGTNSNGNYYFQANSGEIANVVKFSSLKNSCQNNSAYNSNDSELRLYYDSKGNGCSIKLEAENGTIINGFELTTSTQPLTKYKADGGTAINLSYSNNNVASATGLSCSSLEIQNCNTTNVQLKIKKIQITYSAGKTLESIEISGTPTKTTYEAGETFDPAGLKVMGTYEGQTDPEEITSGITWTFDPNPLTAGTTSVSVTAKVGEITSPEYTVNDLTVNARTPYTFGFETATSLDWDFDDNKMKSQETHSDVNPCDGKYFGTTGGKETASMTTKNEVAKPGVLKCYVSKTTANTTTSSWKIQVSSDKNNWTDVKEQSAASMTKGTWVEFAADLSSYKDVYVRIYYSGSSAVRCIDNVSLSLAKDIEYIAVNTAPTKTTYNVGETFDPAGLVITATYKDEPTADIAYAGNESKFTFNPSLTTALTKANDKVTITYGEKSVDQAITVNLNKLATPANLAATNIASTSATLTWDEVANASSYEVKLNGSDVKTAETNSLLVEGLTASTTYTWTVKAIGDNTTYADSDESASSNFTTLAPPSVAYTVTFNGNNHGTPASGSITETEPAAGVTLPDCTPNTGYQFVGWATTETATEAEYEAGDPYYPTANITLYAVYNEVYTINYMVNGVNTDAQENVVKGTALVFPEVTAPDADHVFCGWVTSAIEGTQATAPEYVNTTGLTASENITYYAVFAEKEGGVSGKKAFDYSDFTKSGEGWTCTKDPITVTQAKGGIPTSSSYVTLTEGNLLKITCKKGYKINAIDFTTSEADYTGNLNDVSDLSTTEWELSVDNPGAKTTCRLKSVEVTYSTDVTYSNYCTTFVTKVLESISLSGNYPTVFWKGETFSHEGMTVTAHYENAEDEDVTEKAEFTGYDMASAGEQEVTVTYDTKEAKYNITVKTIANTKETAYTVEKAKELIDAGNDLGTEVYVKGTISKIDSYYSTYNSITYWLDDDAFEVYSGLLSKDKEQFSSKDDLSVGEFVIICGKLKKFNSTYELDLNNYLVNYTSAPMSITSAKLSTFIAPFPVEIPEGVQAYTATAGTDAIEYTEVENVIPACTPVVLYKDVTTTYSKTCKGSSLATENSYKEGSLVGTLVDLENVPTLVEGAPTYLLQNNDGKVGFYKTNSEKTYTLKANRAYLVGVNGVDAKDFFDFDGITPTGINEINVSKFPAEGIYDLNGRKLAVPQKGINIINGVKVIVK